MHEVTLVYTEGGGVSHILRWNGSPNNRTSEALCGRSPWPGYWHGTGSQEEEERVKDMRLCVGCGIALSQQGEGLVAR